MFRVGDVMTTPPQTVTEETTTLEALQLLRTRAFRRLPVVDPNGALVGIVTQTDLLHAVIADLEEASRVSVACNPIDVEALFEQLGREFRALVPEGVSLHWRNELGTQPILGDHAKLKASLKNVVDNALKFTTAGRVEVMAAWADGLLTFVVQDTGIGIPAADLSHIFELFRQVDASDTRRFAGVGLGLHVVKRLLDVP